MDEYIKQQYTSAYGSYVPGEYAIEDQIATRHYVGTVIWSYNVPGKGLTYVVDTGSGFPVEAAANTVIVKREGKS